MATGDITAIVIRADGFSADVTIEGWAAKSVASYAEGTLPDSGNMKLTVTSEGYNSVGTLGTIARTVSGTLVMRKAYPNEASFDETIVSTDLVVRIAFTDCIYNDDKNGGAGTSGTDPVAVITSGYITAGDESVTNAHAGLTCTNNSTLDYPKVIGQWDWDTTPAFNRVNADFIMGFRAVHGFGIASVYLGAVGATSAVDTNSIKTSVTKQASSLSGLYHESYQQSVTLSSYTQAESINLNAIAYPVIGDADSILDTSTITTILDTPTGNTQITCTCDKTDALRVYAVVTTTGNDGTGVISATLATAEANPYATIGAALLAGASLIYTRTGTHDILGSDPTTGVAVRDYTYDIMPHPSDSVSGITIDRGGSFQFNRVTKIRYSGFNSITCAISGGYLKGTQDRILQFEDSTFSTTVAPSAGLSYQAIGAWFTNCTVDGTDHLKAFNGGSLYTFTGCTFVDNVLANSWRTLVACNHQGATSIAFDIDDSRSSVQAPENMLMAHNAIYAAGGQTPPILRIGDAVISGVAVVGNILEMKTYTTGKCAVIYGDANTVPSNNVVITNNTIVGSRVNLFYNDTGTVSVLRTNSFVQRNAFSSYNIKTDTYGTPSGNRTGNWAQRNGVNYKDNIYDMAADITLDVPEYYGINVSYETTLTIEGASTDLGFVDDQCHWGAGGGNGDYTPDTGSPLIGHTLIQSGIAYDLFGNPISTEIGAVQIVSAVLSSAWNKIVSGRMQGAAGVRNSPFITRRY